MARSSISVAGECASALTDPLPNADVSTFRNVYHLTLFSIISSLQTIMFKVASTLHVSKM